MVFFRQGERGIQSGSKSAWRIDDVYLAHAAVTDIDGKQFHYAERLNRAGPGIAGASFADRRIWNGNWQTRWNGERQTLTALTEDFRFDLALVPAKPFVIHGQNGVSQKSEGAGHASHYVSYPRLRVTGVLNGAAVTGDAWMDHEWFTEQLAKTQTGWDWFSAQLNDGTELMLFELRLKNGTVDPYSAGTFIGKAGKAHHLTARDFELRPSEYWISPKNGARYPVSWHIRVPSLHIDMKCSAAVASQELVTSGGRNSYWEGSVSYSGSHAGHGYLEMTGYNKPVSFE